MGHYVIHVHCACSHEYSGEVLHGFVLNGEYSEQDDEGAWYLALLHPRWCSSCLIERSIVLDQIYEQRLQTIERCRRHAEEIRKEVAYLRGVRDGRIAALSICIFEQAGENANDIQNINDGTGFMGGMEMGSDANEKVGNGEVQEVLDEVMDLIEELEVAPRQVGDVERAEDLSTNFQRTDIRADEVTEEIEMCLKEEEAYNSGVVEGQQQQSEAEWKALMMEQDIDRREELMQMALL